MFSDDHQQRLGRELPTVTPWDIGEPQTAVKRLVALAVRSVVRSSILAPGATTMPLTQRYKDFQRWEIDGSGSAIERAKVNMATVRWDISYLCPAAYVGCL